MACQARPAHAPRHRRVMPAVFVQTRTHPNGWIMVPVSVCGVWHAVLHLSDARSLTNRTCVRYSALASGHERPPLCASNRQASSDTMRMPALRSRGHQRTIKKTINPPESARPAVRICPNLSATTKKETNDQTLLPSRPLALLASPSRPWRFPSPPRYPYLTSVHKTGTLALGQQEC